MSSGEIDEHIAKRYEIKRRLGKGAYGIVWKAVDKRTHEVVAVKKIYDAFRNQTDAQRTFREIMFLQEFRNHPNIIKLRSIHRATNNKDIYLVFEYMDTDLHNVIRRGSILKDVHKRFIMYQLLKATKYIHSGNVIHRDQKPSNILLDSDCICKIADFGLARSMSQLGAPSDGSGEHTADPALTDYVATRWYRAPEILIGSKWYTQGIDMWSLGCILAEMFLGKPLFQGSSTINQIELIMSTIPSPTSEDLASVCSTYGGSLLQKAPVGPHRSLEELLQNAPPDGVDLVCKLLVFNPHKRLTAVEALQHSYVQRFHSEVSEPILGHAVMPPLRDDIQLSVDDYRNKLYELMATGNKARSKQNKIRESRSQKFVEQSQLRQIYQPANWSKSTHDIHSKKGRHMSAEMLTVHSVPEHSVSVPVGAHLVPAQSDMNLRGRFVAVPIAQNKRTGSVHQHQQQQQSSLHLPRAVETVHRATGDGPNQQQIEQPKLVSSYFRPKSNTVPVSHGGNRKLKLHRQQQIPQIQQQSREPMPFNSYSHNHGIITASALLELRPTLRW